MIKPAPAGLTAPARPLAFTPLGFTPPGVTPLGFTPLGFTPLGVTPLGFTPLGFTMSGPHDAQVMAIDELAARDQHGGMALAR